jgi:hypothetical protein
MLALCAQEEAIEAAVLAHGGEAVPASGEEFVDVALVADIEYEFVVGGIKDAVESDGELYDAQIGSQMAAYGAGVVLGEDVDEFFPDLLGQYGQVLLIELLDIGGRIDLVEKTHWA